MIIDIHTHTFPDKIAVRAVDSLSEASRTIPFSDGTNQGLHENAARAGIDLSVVQPVATSPAQVEKINDSAIRVNTEWKERGIISFGGMHPEYENYKQEMKRIRSLGVRGIKIHPVYQGTDLDDIRFLRILSCAAELGLIVLTHTGWDIGFPGVVHCSPKMAANAIDQVGRFPFILAHMGGWKQWEEVPECLADSGAYLDTSVSTGLLHPKKEEEWREEEKALLSPEQFMELFKAFGEDRILFATDSPWSPAEEALRFIRELPITDRQKAKIFGENAKRLLCPDNQGMIL